MQRGNYNFQLKFDAHLFLTLSSLESHSNDLLSSFNYYYSMWEEEVVSLTCTAIPSGPGVCTARLTTPVLACILLRSDGVMTDPASMAATCQPQMSAIPRHLTVAEDTCTATTRITITRKSLPRQRMPVLSAVKRMVSPITPPLLVRISA